MDDRGRTTFTGWQLWGAPRLSVLHEKRKLLIQKAQTGSLPEIGEFETAFEYRPKGMDGDVYALSGDNSAILIAKKGEPFILGISVNRAGIEPHMIRYLQKWKGTPDPKKEPAWQVKLIDGTTIVSETNPAHGKNFRFTEKRLPPSKAQYSVKIFGTDVYEQIPIEKVEEITPMRETGDEPTTYLIQLQLSNLNLARLPE